MSKTVSVPRPAVAHQGNGTDSVQIVLQVSRLPSRVAPFAAERLADQAISEAGAPARGFRFWAATV
jgi:hypothetical protein